MLLTKLHSMNGLQTVNFTGPDIITEGSGLSASEVFQVAHILGKDVDRVRTPALARRLGLRSTPSGMRGSSGQHRATWES